MNLFLQSLSLLKYDKRLLWWGIIIVLCGGEINGIEFLRMHLLHTMLQLDTQSKIFLFVIQIAFFVLQLLAGTFLLPLSIIIVNSHSAKGRRLSTRNALRQVAKKLESFFSLLFCYDILLFILSGGGLLVVLQALLSSILYAKTAVTIYDITAHMPLFTSFITIAIVLSTFMSMLFAIVSQVVVLEKGHFSSKIIKGIHLFNENLPFILTAWLFLGMVLVLPLMLLLSVLHLLSYIALLGFVWSKLALVSGFISVTLIYGSMVALEHVYWTKVYLQTKGLLIVDMAMDR